MNVPAYGTSDQSVAETSIRRYVGRTAFTQELIRQINRKGT